MDLFHRRGRRRTVREAGQPTHILGAAGELAEQTVHFLAEAGKPMIAPDDAVADQHRTIGKRPFMFEFLRGAIETPLIVLGTASRWCSKKGKGHEGGCSPEIAVVRPGHDRSPSLPVSLAMRARVQNGRTGSLFQVLAQLMAAAAHNDNRRVAVVPAQIRASPSLWRGIQWARVGRIFSLSLVIRLKVFRAGAAGVAWCEINAKEKQWNGHSVDGV